MIRSGIKNVLFITFSDHLRYKSPDVFHCPESRYRIILSRKYKGRLYRYCLNWIRFEVGLTSVLCLIPRDDSDSSLGCYLACKSCSKVSSLVLSRRKVCCGRSSRSGY